MGGREGRGGVVLNRCWGRAWIYTRSVSPDSSSVFCLGLFFLLLFSSSAVHLCTWQHRGGSPEWFNLFSFHHVNKIIAENHCAELSVPRFSSSPGLLCTVHPVTWNIDSSCLFPSLRKHCYELTGKLNSWKERFLSQNGSQFSTFHTEKWWGSMFFGLGGFWPFLFKTNFETKFCIRNLILPIY